MTSGPAACSSGPSTPTPSDLGVSEHLYRLSVRSERWEHLPGLARTLVLGADDAEGVRKLLEFEPHVAKSGLETWLELAEKLLARTTSAPLQFARARLLAS